EGYVGDGPQPFVDGWLRSGDLAYLADGELYVVGRSKDVIIVGGRNYAPEDLEWAAGRVTGVRPGRCVAFARPGGREGEVVVVVEPAPDADGERVAAAVRAAVLDAIGIPVQEVVVAATGTVLKTTSGKLRRSALRDAYAAGSL